MALVLNTNIASMNAQRNLASTQAQQSVTFQRLSTGLRINSAKDDAAGLYLAQSQTKDIRGLNMATRNASDGISMAQTAEGALDQVAQNLQRINELAIQSANGTYNNAAREGLQKEVDQLTQEINRIVETTEFNGQKLLNRDATSTTLQIGFRDDENSRIETGLAGGLVAQGDPTKFTFEGSDRNFFNREQANAVGQLALSQSLLKDGISPETVLDNATAYAATDFAALNGLAAGTTGKEIADGVKQLGNGQSFTVDGMTFTRQPSNTIDKIGTQLEISFDGKTTTVAGVWDNTTGAYNPGAAIAVTNMEDLFGSDGAGGTVPVSPLQPLAEQYFGVGQTDYTDVALDQLKAFDQGLLQTLRGGESVELDGVTFTRGTGGSADELRISSEWMLNTVTIAGTFNADGTVIGIASDATDPTDGLPAAAFNDLFGNAAKGVNNLADLLNGELDGTKVIDISSPESARSAIEFTRDAIDLISEIRATFGAVMNRFEAVISGNNIYSENLSAARSRIQDADFAQETSNLAKQQVLQQAGIASLSQANASSQAILSLLG